MSKGPKERLLEAKDLYEMGVLTEDEYGEIKRECIVQMKGMTTTPPPSHFPQSSSIILDAMLSKTLLIQNILQQVGWVSFESVLLPPGSFMMGAKEGDFDDEDDEDDAQPRHEVELSSGFWMMSTPVTQDLYESLMNNNPSEFKGGRRPVEYVSWFDAVQCANALSRKQGLKEVYTIDGEDVEADWSANGWRLPTEAEWEYAARAGTDFKYSGSNNLDEVGWHSGNSGGQTHPVGEKKPNGWGLYDMSGNVEEWCWDWYGDYPSSKQTDPKGPKTGSNRVCRGGSWDVVARGARVSIRLYCDPSDRSIYLGFRFSRSSL